MRIIYTMLLSIFTTVTIAQVSTCSLDPVFIASNKKGIWPDSVTNFLSGTVGVPYFQNLTIKVPKDTIAGPVTMCFNRVEVSTSSLVTNFNLPPGLSMLAGTGVTLTSGIYKFPGNANRCAEISGTPTVAGTYSLQFKVQPFLTPAIIPPCTNSPNVAGGSGSLSAPSTLMYYKIIIAPPAGIKEEVSVNSFKLNNTPNPFNGKTNINFIVGDETNAVISVYNLLGGKVFEHKFKTNFGLNSYELDCENWDSGIYLYTVQYKNHSQTKRLVVNSAR